MLVKEKDRHVLASIVAMTARQRFPSQVAETFPCARFRAKWTSPRGMVIETSGPLGVIDRHRWIDLPTVVTELG